jgi:hypothetical protein
MEEPEVTGSFTMKRVMYSGGFRIARAWSNTFKTHHYAKLSYEEVQRKLHRESLDEFTRGYRFSRKREKWVPCMEMQRGRAARNGEMLRIATFNVLNNPDYMEFMSHTRVRYEHQLDALLPSLDADVFCVNEVTNEWLSMALQREWIRDGYYVSTENLNYGNAGN